MCPPCCLGHWRFSASARRRNCWFTQSGWCRRLSACALGPACRVRDRPPVPLGKVRPSYWFPASQRPFGAFLEHRENGDRSEVGPVTLSDSHSVHSKRCECNAGRGHVTSSEGGSERRCDLQWGSVLRSHARVCERDSLVWGLVSSLPPSLLFLGLRHPLTTPQILSIVRQYSRSCDLVFVL